MLQLSLLSLCLLGLLLVLPGSVEVLLHLLLHGGLLLQPPDLVLVFLLCLGLGHLLLHDDGNLLVPGGLLLQHQSLGHSLGFLLAGGGHS